MLLVAGAALFGPAPAAHAGVEIWSATLTPGSRTVGTDTVYGWDDSGNYSGASLTDQDFTFSGETYNLDEVLVTATGTCVSYSIRTAPETSKPRQPGTSSNLKSPAGSSG